MYWSPPERARLIDHDAAGPGTLGTEPGHGDLGRNCLRIVSVHLHEYSVPRGTGNARSCRDEVRRLSRHERHVGKPGGMRVADPARDNRRRRGHLGRLIRCDQAHPRSQSAVGTRHRHATCRVCALAGSATIISRGELTAMCSGVRDLGAPDLEGSGEVWVSCLDSLVTSLQT